MNLPDTPAVRVIKAVFCINVIISIAMCTFPANEIIESYSSINVSLQRCLLFAMAIGACLALGTSLDKFNSLVGTVTATPVVFIVPCIAHYRLCNPTALHKALDIAVIIIALMVLLGCTGFTLYTWND